MAFVITRLCQNCVEGSCVDVCPKDCIVEHRPQGGESDLPHQLFIDPGECIDCHACVPECPWDAIYPDTNVPDVFEDDIALNARAALHPEEYHVPTSRLRRGATREEVEDNKRRWGLTTKIPA